MLLLELAELLLMMIVFLLAVSLSFVFIVWMLVKVTDYK